MWKQPGGFGRPSSLRGGLTVWAPLGGLLEKPAGAAAQTTKTNTVALRVKRKRGREWAGGHSPSGGGAASGPSWLTAGSDGVVRPVMVTLGPAYCSRGQQKQSQPPAFCTRNRNNTQYTTALVVKIASMSGSRRWMCQRVLRKFNGKGQGRGDWLWIPYKDSPAVDRDVVDSSSGGAEGT